MGEEESGHGFPIRATEMVRNQTEWWLHIIVNVERATELFTLKWLILCYMDFTSTEISILFSVEDLSSHGV